MTLVVLGAYLLLAATLLFFVRADHGQQGVLGSFGVVALLLYGLRATILAFGLDLPEPDQFFETGNDDVLLAETLLLTAAFLGILIGAFLLSGRRHRVTRSVYATRIPDVRRMMRVTLALTVVGAVVTAVLASRFGGLHGITRAGKISGGLSGLYALRVFAAFGALIGAATVVDAYRQRKPTSTVLAAAVCAVLDSYFVYVWGTRTVVIVVLAIFVLGIRRARVDERGPQAPRTRTAAPRNVTLARVVVAALLVIVVATLLREHRASVLNTKGDTATQGVSVWRKISLSADATTIDASMLALRDDGHVYTYPTGADLTDGLTTAVPSFVVSHAGVETQGSRFRHYYQPEVRNGWPVGTATEWYLNFGLLGVVVGALASGLLLRRFVDAERAAPPCGLNMTASFVVAVYVISLGINADTPSHVVLWLIPMVLATKYCTRAPRRNEATATAAAVAPPPLRLLPVPAALAPGAGPRWTAVFARAQVVAAARPTARVGAADGVP